MDIFGTLLVIIGATIAAIFGQRPKVDLTNEQLLELFKRTFFIVYFTILNVIVIAINTFSYIVQKKHQLDLSQNRNTSNIRKLFIGIGFSSCAGLLASQSVVLSDTFVSLIRTSFSETNQFTSFEPFIIVILMIIISLRQVIFTNIFLTI